MAGKAVGSLPPGRLPSVCDSRLCWQDRLLYELAAELSTQLCCLIAAFQLFDSFQAISSYVRGVICAQALMKGLGVGKEVK